jgi:hypothetical protein
MSERETVVELPFAADCCPCVEKLRTVLPLTVGIRDSEGGREGQRRTGGSGGGRVAAQPHAQRPLQRDAVVRQRLEAQLGAITKIEAGDTCGRHGGGCQVHPFVLGAPVSLVIA